MIATWKLYGRDHASRGIINAQWKDSKYLYYINISWNRHGTCTLKEPASLQNRDRSPPSMVRCPPSLENRTGVLVRYPPEKTQTVVRRKNRSMPHGRNTPAAFCLKTPSGVCLCPFLLDYLPSYCHRAHLSFHPRKIREWYMYAIYGVAVLSVVFV